MNIKVPLNIFLNNLLSPTVDQIGKIRDIPSEAYKEIPKKVNIFYI